MGARAFEGEDAPVQGDFGFLVIDDVKEEFLALAEWVGGTRPAALKFEAAQGQEVGPLLPRMVGEPAGEVVEEGGPAGIADLGCEGGIDEGRGNPYLAANWVAVDFIRPGVILASKVLYRTYSPLSLTISTRGMDPVP